MLYNMINIDIYIKYLQNTLSWRRPWARNVYFCVHKVPNNVRVYNVNKHILFSKNVFNKYNM